MSALARERSTYNTHIHNSNVADAGGTKLDCGARHGGSHTVNGDSGALEYHKHRLVLISGCHQLERRRRWCGNRVVSHDFLRCVGQEGPDSYR